MTTKFATDYDADVLEALDDIGIDVTLTELTGAAVDTTTQRRTAGTEVVHVIKAFPPYAIDHEEAELSGLEVGDIRLVAKGPLPFEVKNEVVLDFDGVKYTLNQHFPLFPGDKIAAHELFFSKGPT